MPRLYESRAARRRRGSVLVEFCLIALVLYLIMAATLEFGRTLFGAQILQQAADTAARELARTPGLPAVGTLTDWNDLTNTNAAFNTTIVKQTIFDEQYLVVDIANGLDYFNDKPILNRLLAPLMIADHANGVLRYPGAMIADTDVPSGFRVKIPIVTYTALPGTSGAETFVKYVPVVEEILPDTTIDSLSSYSADSSPFSLASTVQPASSRGVISLRINYPFQSSMLSATAPPADPSLPNFQYIDTSDDASFGTPAPDGDMGTYAGTEGLGNQQAFGKIVRPFRRLVSAQAIYRRELVGP